MISKTKKYFLPGEFLYDFRPPFLCANCDLPREKHFDGECIFDATRFIPDALTSFLERFLYQGGELIFRVGEDTLSVPVKLNSTDRHFAGWEERSTLRCQSNGNAVLEIVPDAKNRQKLLDHVRRRWQKDTGGDGTEK